MTLVYVLAFITGLIFGSFYNVIALRTLNNEKLSYPPSHCTICNHKLSFLDLFPVLSYLFLKGQCRYCKSKISIIYPIGELLTAVSYTIIVYTYGLTITTFIHIVFITCMIVASVTDMKETIVPDRIIIFGLIIVFLLRLTQDSLVYYVISMIVSFVMLYLILIFSAKEIENEKGEIEIAYGMGGADVKLYALIGLAIGLQNAVGSLFYASIIGILFQLPSMVINKDLKKGVEIPFVPFITLGILCTYIFDLFKFI